MVNAHLHAPFCGKYLDVIVLYPGNVGRLRPIWCHSYYQSPAGSIIGIALNLPGDFFREHPNQSALGCGYRPGQ